MDNIFTFLFLILALAGITDKALNNRFGLGECIDKGLGEMKNFCFSLLGFYCVLTTLGELASSLSAFPVLGLLTGLFLAPDLGGYALASAFCPDESTLFFCGILLTSTIGCTISFQFPVLFPQIHKKNSSRFMKGILIGLFALFPVLFIFSIPLWTEQMILVILLLVLYILLLLAFIRWPERLINALKRFAQTLRIAGIALFGISVASALLFNGPVSADTLTEGVFVVFRISLILAGSQVFCALIDRIARKQMKHLAARIQTQPDSILGLLLSLSSSIAMIGLYNDMDPKGQLMNAAFSVSGAYALGAQMGFIAAMSNTKTTLLFIAAKLLGGLCALILAEIFSRYSPNKGVER